MAELSDKAREEFFSEAQEIIETLSRNLLSLDASIKAGTTDPSLINEAFRAVHTLKGLAGLFGADDVELDPPVLLPAHLGGVDQGKDLTVRDPVAEVLVDAPDGPGQS